MFLDESAFDLEDNDKGYNRRPVATENRYSKNPGPVTNYHDADNNNYDDDDGARMPSFGSAGGIGTPTSSRARMLAQQRDIQQKKRLSAYQSGGMVRSSINALPSGASTPEDNDETPSKGENQFTPAVRQFSAPKAFKDETSNEQNSEFRLPTARKAVMQVPQTAHNYQLQTGHNRKSSRFSDDEDEEEETVRSLRSTPQRGTPGGNGSNSNSNRKGAPDGARPKFPDSIRNAEDEDDEGDYDRRKGRNQSTPTSNSRRRSSDRSEYHDDDDDNDDDGNYHGSTATTTRSSQNYNSYKNQDYYDVRKNSPPGKWEMPNSNKQKHSERERQSEYDKDRHTDRDAEKDRTSRRGSQSSDSARQGAFIATPLDLRNMRHFLTTPLPRSAGVIQCYIRRNKSGTNKLFPVYSLFLKDTDMFLMASKKRPNNKTSNYLISMGEGDLSRDGTNYLGKLRSNFVGTEFQIFDSGSNPKESEADEHSPNRGGGVRKDLGAVMYAANVLGSRGPRKMQVALPSVDELGKGSVRNSSGEDILTRMRDRSHRDLAYLINKPPKWNDQVGAYVLNFNGRVTMASVKNFQLVDPDDQKAVVLQFGKVSRDEYTMDMQWPITPFQAFAVTLSSFDLKIACD